MPSRTRTRKSDSDNEEHPEDQQQDTDRKEDSEDTSSSDDESLGSGSSEVTSDFEGVPAHISNDDAKPTTAVGTDRGRGLAYGEIDEGGIGRWHEEPFEVFFSLLPSGLWALATEPGTAWVTPGYLSGYPDPYPEQPISINLRVLPTKRAQKRRIGADLTIMTDFVRKHKISHNLVKSEPFWTFLGSFERFAVPLHFPTHITIAEVGKKDTGLDEVAVRGESTMGLTGSTYINREMQGYGQPTGYTGWVCTGMGPGSSSRTRDLSNEPKNVQNGSDLSKLWPSAKGQRLGIGMYGILKDSTGIQEGNKDWV
ncbi:hypothetical protein CPC08DRAFT_726698 [Agrocybe pediades]|nr:hypothetical protein CPC08DRAFT_726698 [Agrocybe pediades]